MYGQTLFGVLLLTSLIDRWSFLRLGFLPMCLWQASLAMNAHANAWTPAENGPTDRSAQTRMLVAQANASEKPNPVQGAEPAKEKTDKEVSKAPAIKGSLAALKPFD